MTKPMTETQANALFVKRYGTAEGWQPLLADAATLYNAFDAIMTSSYVPRSYTALTPEQKIARRAAQVRYRTRRRLLKLELKAKTLKGATACA
jgi:hypothetical protein